MVYKFKPKYYKVAARQHLENPDLVRRIMDLNKKTFVSIPTDWDKHANFAKYDCVFCIV